jgi:pimeloyl-ACP methyl ester carboxylesterase
MDFVSFSVYGLMAQDIVTQAFDLRKNAGAYTGAVLSIHARQDITGFQAAYDILTSYMHVNMQVIEQAGHYCWLEQPEVFFKIVKSFLIQ